jgi:hypothetical protein
MTPPVESYPVDLHSLPHHWSPRTVLAAAYVGIVNSDGPRNRHDTPMCRLKITARPEVSLLGGCEPLTRNDA